ncbi:hypothetical protein RDWZM_008734 [Blomia tropicalis]|uniref:Carboxylesterase type B domain-containing protein n=1 Tax=Blomia tropicalis TaxID=40697 RepID=A0A9Q0M4V0_BLOTA|nr:hypothetical protein RDWZM_008734 [Blomia tropicalis]
MTMSNDKQSSYRFESAIIIKSKPSSTTTFTWTVNLNRFVRHSIHFHHIIALLIIFVICSCTLAENRASSRVVKTKYGNLRGFYTNFPNKNLQPVETFLGIPYASPPMGKLRFMPPVTPAIWSGVRNANQYGPVCPQRLVDLRNESEVLQTMTKGRLKILRRMHSMLNNQSEDCLYLNIYAPTTVGRDGTRLPVLMFIHGESFEWNAGSSYDGSVLASYSNMVVVTINFRLGILGFFPSPGGSARGNFGLMDQVAALHWIQENIREFGGDERNVTIMGYGHGAACVNFLMLSPMARGLFQRAIMQSGSALSPWAIASDAMMHAKNLANTLGCGDSSNSNGILECLRHKSVLEITSVPLRVPTHLTAFGPVIDGIVIPNDPQILMSKMNSIFGNYQLLFGVGRVESYEHFSMYDERHGIDVGRRDRLLRTLIRNMFNYHLQEIFYTIINEYTDWTRPFFHPISLFDSLVDIFSDSVVVAPAIQVGLLHSKQSRGTYFYNFVHQTENGDYNPRLGCVHGQDMAYLFGAPLVNGFQLSWFSQNYTRTEVALSENYIQMLTHFAKTGYNNPNNNHTETSMFRKEKYPVTAEHIHWPLYEEIQQKYLIFGTKLMVQDHYLSHRLSYWFNLLPQLHKSGNANSEHHLLESHNNIQSYDGVVRYGSLSAPVSLGAYFPVDHQHESNGSSRTTGTNRISPHDVNSHATNNSLTEKNNRKQQSALDQSNSFNNSNKKLDDGNASFSMIVQSGNYSTALSLTIAIGCSLLILNVLVFAGIFYQKDRNRLETKLMRKKNQNIHQKGKTEKNVKPGGGAGVNPVGAGSANMVNNVQMYRINSISDDYNQRNVVS